MRLNVWRPGRWALPAAARGGRQGKQGLQGPPDTRHPPGQWWESARSVVFFLISAGPPVLRFRCLCVPAAMPTSPGGGKEGGHGRVSVFSSDGRTDANPRRAIHDALGRQHCRHRLLGWCAALVIDPSTGRRALLESFHHAANCRNLRKGRPAFRRAGRGRRCSLCLHGGRFRLIGQIRTTFATKLSKRRREPLKRQGKRRTNS